MLEIGGGLWIIVGIGEQIDVEVICIVFGLVDQLVIVIEFGGDVLVDFCCIQLFMVVQDVVCQFVCDDYCDFGVVIFFEIVFVDLYDGIICVCFEIVVEQDFEL